VKFLIGIAVGVALERFCIVQYDKSFVTIVRNASGLQDPPPPHLKTVK
jgi:hypothetical protein